MADNVPLNLGSGGATAVAREISHGGDTAQLQGVFIMGVTGSEGSYTAAAINGDATNGIDVDITRANYTGNVDTAAGATQIGIPALTVRDDALATLTEADGDLSLVRTNARGALWVALDSTAAQTVTLAAGTATNEVVGDAAHDAAVAGNPLLVGARASAAVPTDVSADNDVTQLWALRSGALAVQPTFGGVLAVAGNGGVGTGVQRVTLANDSTGVIATVNTVGTISTSVVPGTGATHLGKAEDAAHTTGDTGVMVFGVRRDADTSLVDTTGDYAPFQLNAAGSLKVAITSGAGSGGTSIADAAAFTRATTSVTPVAGVVETAAPTLTNGNTGALSLTTGGAVRVAVASGGVAGVVEDAVASGTAEGILGILVRDDALATLTPVDGDYTVARTNARGAMWVALDSTAAQTVTLAAGTATNEVVGDAAIDAAIAGNPVLIGGRASTATPSAMSADNDAQALWLTLNGAAVVAGANVDDSAFTPGTTRVVAVGLQADETATDSVDEGDVGCPRMTLDRKAITTEYVHAAAGGSSNYTALSTAAVLTAEIKSSAGKVFGIQCFNTNAAARYVRLYNQTGAPASTDTANVVWQGIIPGATTGAGFVVQFPKGKQFTTGIGIRATTGIAHNDTGALAANELTFNVDYV